MGHVDAEIHVLDFNRLTDEALRGSRYRIAKDDSFTYSFDSTPLDKSFANLANGALFVQYLQRTSSKRRPPEPELLENFFCPRSSEGASRWEWRLFDPKEEPKEEPKRVVGILLVLVLPVGHTSPVADFNFRPRAVQSTADSRIRFLFIEEPPDGLFVLKWRTTPMQRPIDEEVQLAFEDISKIPEHKVEIDTLHRYNATSKGKPAAGGLVGRTVWDVLADAWMSRRWWLIAFVAIALLLGLAISHVQTRPGKDVSLFGISLYTKGGASDLRENR